MAKVDKRRNLLANFSNAQEFNDIGACRRDDANRIRRLMYNATIIARGPLREPLLTGITREGDTGHG